MDVSTSIRLDEDFPDESQLAAIRAALQEGEESGEPTAFGFNAFIASKKEKAGQETRHH